MNKKMILLLCSTIACNGCGAMGEDATMHDLQRMQAVIEAIDIKPYMGIVKACAQACEVCKEGEKRIAKNMTELVGQTREHFLTLLGEAFKLMDKEQRRICFDLLSQVHELMVDCKILLEKVMEPGRSDLEREILFEKFQMETQNKLILLGIYCTLLAKATEDSPEFKKQHEEVLERGRAMTNAFLAGIVETVSKAKEMAGDGI